MQMKLGDYNIIGNIYGTNNIWKRVSVVNLALSFSLYIYKNNKLSRRNEKIK